MDDFIKVIRDNFVVIVGVLLVLPIVFLPLIYGEEGFIFAGVMSGTLGAILLVDHFHEPDTGEPVHWLRRTKIRKLIYAVALFAPLILAVLTWNGGFLMLYAPTLLVAACTWYHTQSNVIEQRRKKIAESRSKSDAAMRAEADAKLVDTPPPPSTAAPSVIAQNIAADFMRKQ